MKKNVRVTVTKEFEIDINDDQLTDDAIKEFSSYMFETDINGLFKYVAGQCFSEDDCFVEGLGEAISEYRKKEKDTIIQFKCTSDDYESEII